jgi:hypothetical protein
MSESNYPIGAANDSNAPFNKPSNDYCLKHLCPYCDEDEIENYCSELINENSFDDFEDYEIEVENLKDTARLCRECHKLEISER